MAADHPDLDIKIVGINVLGSESGNGLMTQGVDLPWLQDVDEDQDGRSDVWDNKWSVQWRDVVILDAANRELGAVNLSDYNLANRANLDALGDILIQVAEHRPFWQNPANAMDVNNDGSVTPVGDVLRSINEFSLREMTDVMGRITMPMPDYQPPPYLDVDGDYLFSPVGDVLPMINYLNGQPAGEGEQGPAAVLETAPISVPVFVLPGGDALITEPADGMQVDTAQRANSHYNDVPLGVPSAPATEKSQAAQSRAALVEADGERDESTPALPLLDALAEDVALFWHGGK